MNNEVIEVVAIDTPNADVQILEEALGALGLAPSSFANLETGMATTFLLTDTDGEHELADTLTAYLESWLDILSEKPTVSIRSMKKDDWANSWKKNFHTFRASDRLVVKPSWEDYNASPGEIILPIDPGMCFGTGG